MMPSGIGGKKEGRWEKTNPGAPALRRHESRVQNKADVTLSDTIAVRRIAKSVDYFFFSVGRRS